MRKAITLLLLLCSLSTWAEELWLAPPYTSHCVLQRHQPIRIEGRATAGSTVTVTLAGNTTTVVTDKDGTWVVTLPPMTQGIGLTLTVINDGTTKRLDDIAIGEVWVASGQSNMAFMLSQATGGAEDIAQAEDSLLRFLDMKPRYQTTSQPWSEEARREVNASHYYATPLAWQHSTPQSASTMSAVAYHFARMLRDSLQVPVGIIHNSIGGAPTESWIDKGTLRALVPEVLSDSTLIQDWVLQRTRENVGTAPEQQHPYKPGYLFHTGIEALYHYPVAGVLWYQGESNAHNISLHERLFQVLVDNWRHYWGKPQLPFIFAQLSSIARPTWPQFRDSQRRLAQQLPMAGMAVTSDHGDSLDVHPRDKRPVGERMARWALNNVYSFAHVTPSGPQPLTATAHGAEVMVPMQWSHGLHSSDGQPLRTFELAGSDGIFYPATARVVADGMLAITSTQVTTPHHVRYAWQPFTRANLVNSDGLPASTFSLMIETINDGYAHGVSAPFAGYTGGCAIVAGGCNFPENPLARDSKKVFYDGIYRIDGSELRLVGHLPHPVAYGMSATTPDGIVMAGGTGSRDAWLVTMHDGQAVVKALPPLPCDIDNAAACAIGSKVYVAGGNTLLCFDGTLWISLPPIPGNPRTQPVMAAGKNSKGEECLWLFSGFNAAGAASTLELDGLVYIPSKKKWQRVAGPTDETGAPLCVAGGCAATMSDGRIIVTGGVNKDIFLAALRNPAPDYLSHPAEWYRFNDAVLLFDPAKQQWQRLRRDPDAARAGSALIPCPDGTLLLYGGELKPRIRTPKVHTVDYQ